VQVGRKRFDATNSRDGDRHMLAGNLFASGEIQSRHVASDILTEWKTNTGLS